MPMSREELDAFLAKIPAMPTAKQVKLFVKVREAKAASNRAASMEEAQFNEILDTCQNFMLATADAEGVKGFSTEWGTTYTAETSKVTIADEKAFFDFVLAQKDLDFFEKRVSAKHLEEFTKNNPTITPPGLNIFRERAMRVRKAGDK